MVEPSGDYPTVEAGGASIPRLGFGTWQITGQECADIVESALDFGYRHIDTAQKYDNETMVGEGIAAADIGREDVFLTTKITLKNLLNDNIIDSVHESLDRLDVDHVDLLLAHAPHPRMDIEDTLAKMAQLREEGYVDHLGVSNFTQTLLQMAIDATGVPIVTNQVQYHPCWDQSDLQTFCAENDVALTAYSPLARGRVIDDDTLAAIGAHHDKTAAQVALRWLLQQEGVVAIPKTTNPDHLEQNLAVFDFELTDKEVTRINELTPSPRQRLAYGIRGTLMRIASGIWKLT